MSDSLVGLEGITLRKELDGLAGAAYKSLQVLVPWRGASTNHAKLEKVIQKIQAYSLIYLEAIEISVKTAQNSNGLGSDVIELCGHLLNPETNPDDLQEYITDIQRKAKLACEDCTKTVAKFEDVRQSLNEIKTQFPKEVITKDRGISKYLGRISAFGSKEANQRDTGLDAAMAELSLGVLDVSALSQGLDALEKWCKGMERIMKGAERGVSELSATSGGPGVDSLRKEWERALKDYERYKEQASIVKVQDQYMAQISAATPGALSRLEINTPHKILNSIVESAYKSMQIIEPWRQASSDHSALSKVIQDIRCLGLVYYEAIDISINTAQNGYDFSADAVQLCELLLNQETNVEELREYIQDMKNKAKRACEECTNTLNKFRDVRQGLNEITKRIPEEVVENDKTKHFIRIPYFGDQNKPKRDTGLVDAVKELNLAIIDLGALSESVDMFATWWDGMETVMKAVERSGSGLRPGKDKLRVKQVQRTWTGIKDDYKQYKSKIVQLQDYYPSQRTEIQASNKE